VRTAWRETRYPRAEQPPPREEGIELNKGKSAPGCAPRQRATDGRDRKVLNSKQEPALKQIYRDKHNAAVQNTKTE